MPLYGILKTSTNTGLDSELQCVFSTPLTVISNQPAFWGDTLNLRRKVSSQNVQRWEIETNIITTTDATDFIAHSVNAGLSELVYLRMPQPLWIPSRVAEVVGLSLTLSANAAVNATSLSVAGLNSKSIKGMFITIAGSSKVHLVTEMLSTTSVKIAPRLPAAISSGAVIKHSANVTMTAYYDSSSIIGMKYDNGVLSNPGTLRFVEKLP
jgi:hypothetical protein